MSSVGRNLAPSAAPARNDGVATRARLPRETRRLSHGPVDGVTVASRRVDAIDAYLKFRKLRKQTLSQRLRLDDLVVELLLDLVDARQDAARAPLLRAEFRIGPVQLHF